MIARGEVGIIIDDDDVNDADDDADDDTEAANDDSGSAGGVDAVTALKLCAGDCAKEDGGRAIEASPFIDVEGTSFFCPTPGC